MNIFLLGYMGSGKSTIGKRLAIALDYDFLDFDAYIVSQEGESIPEIFETKGEIYFRKKESFYLKKLIEENRSKTIIALGGGTPCYGNNIQLLEESDAYTVYINVPYKTLAARLWTEKDHRPLIAGIRNYEGLEDYVRKHIFERGFYYNRAQEVVRVTNEDSQEVVEKIITRLF